MVAATVGARSPFSPPATESTPASLSLREAISQTYDSSRNLLGLMALATAAERDLNSGSAETTLDGVISKAVLRSLLGALHFRDIGTLRHSRRVALLAVGLAHHLGWEGRHLRVLEVAALLHDIGKIGVPDNVLYKPGKLSLEEIELMDLHHGIGLNVLQACRVDSEVLRIVDQAHRAYDAKECHKRSIREVHIGARILAVADAYESLCTEQVYRVAKSHDDIMNLLMAESGKQFDGNVVASLARWVQQDGLPFAAQSTELNDLATQRAPGNLEETVEAMALCQIFSYLYMLESLYDGFHIIDAERRFVVWNRAAERVFGRSATTVLGHEWDPALFGAAKPTDPKTETRVMSSIDNAIVCGRAVMHQYPFLNHDQPADQTEITLEVQTVPLFDARGRLHGIAEIFRNLSRKSHAPEFKQLQLKATRDPLTSVANRGELEKQLRYLTEQYLENPAEPFCIIFADADHFKRINDTFGHQVGDQVLIDLAKHLNDETYSGEVVGRYGGEEFVILCPATTLDQAVRRAERLRTSLQNARIGDAERLKITCSFGVAQMESADTAESVLGRADRALYAAKEGGRDRTCSFTSQQLNSSAEPDFTKDDKAVPFQFNGSFAAVLACEMVMYKLGGFVKDHKALIIDVAHDRVVVRLRGAGVWGYFESSHDRQGLEIELLIEAASRSDQSKKLQINVNMRPHGWFTDAHSFDKRTKSVMRELKHYFAAE